MRVVARICAALLALAFVAAIALYVLLPRLVGEDVVRARVSEAAQSAIGRAVDFGELNFELFPPALIAIDVVVGDAAMPLASAERIELTPALAPLLAGVLAIDSAAVEGAEIRLLRKRGEIGLADAGFADRELAEVNRVAEVDRAARSNLAVRGLRLSGAEITLEDRSVDPPLLWVLRDVSGSALVDELDSSVRIDFGGEFATGGRWVGSGEVAVAGELQLEFEFDAVEIAAARRYFAAAGGVGGSLTGAMRVSGGVDHPAIELVATLRDADLELGEIALRGTLEVEASIRDALAAPNGRVDLDATEAELAYAGFFTKAPGTPAHVVGQVTTGEGGSPSIEAWKFVMQDLDGQVRVGTRDCLRLAGRKPADRRSGLGKIR